MPGTKTSLSLNRTASSVVFMLMEAGPALGYPQSTGLNGSKFSHMRELRIRHEGRPYRVLYAFDPVWTAFLSW